MTCLMLRPSGKQSFLRKVETAWGKMLIAAAGCRIECDLSALDPNVNYVFLANHQSNLDIPAFFSILGDYDFRFLAKDSLFRIPLFGHAMRHNGHIEVFREDGAKAMQALRDAVKIAKDDKSILVFPEGTRSPDPNQLLPFKAGGMLIAYRAGLPVAPLVIAGTAAIMPKGTLRLNPGVIRVRALPPLDPTKIRSKTDRATFERDLYTTMNDAYQELHTWKEKTTQ
ncbi:lysophospholipid acyltransferase family protein [Desulfovibrio inopinatus]|uniref:lysophospholipid acyltransferase family protein n=1 Tax=Desulfovibrio inopinatus TaxID=102109 RepID=UPI00146FA65C|nr:lysophospholipid acyltransferase family protein [Desulfovibrio inopinatus]